MTLMATSRDPLQSWVNILFHAEKFGFSIGDGYFIPWLSGQPYGGFNSAISASHNEDIAISIGLSVDKLVRNFFLVLPRNTELTRLGNAFAIRLPKNSVGTSHLTKHPLDSPA